MLAGRSTAAGRRGFQAPLKMSAAKYLSIIWGGFPKVGVIFSRAPIMRIVVFWGLYWGSPILGNYHIFLKIENRKLRYFGGILYTKHHLGLRSL